MNGSDPVKASVPENARGMSEWADRPGWMVRHVRALKSAFRILFGVIWGIDGAMKFSPTLLSAYPAMVSGMGQGQPAWLSGWFSFWANATATNPAIIVYGTGVAELALGFCLIVGFMRKTAYLAGIPLSLLIWGVAEGFGGPYGPGATDIGAAVMYAPAFLLLIVISATYGTSYLSLDAVIERRWPRWSLLAEWSGAGRPRPSSVIAKAPAEPTEGANARSTPSIASRHPTDGRARAAPRPLRAGVAAGLVFVLLVIAAVGVYTTWQTPSPAAGETVPSTDYVNLTVGPGSGGASASFDPVNISLASNATVVFTITVEDTQVYPVLAPLMSVMGTANGTETIRESTGGATATVTGLAAANVSHTFTVFDGPYTINAPLPPAAVAGSPTIVSFSAVFTHPGTYVWTCGPSCVDNAESLFQAGMGGVITVS